jgi:RNA polymerase sigma-70 factor (ECF subfamily)
MPDAFSSPRDATAAPAGHADAEEAELVRKARRREPEAWAQIYDRNYTFIYRYFYARLHNQAEAEDLAAQCFLRALAGIGGYSYRGKPILAWLYRIAANLAADRIKDRLRRSTAVLDESAVSGLQAGPEAAIENLDLLRAIDSLKRAQREVIILRFLMSLPTREVARMLGKSEAAVHSLQVRAVEALRRDLSR